MNPCDYPKTDCPVTVITVPDPTTPPAPQHPGLATTGVNLAPAIGGLAAVLLGCACLLAAAKLRIGR